VPGRPLDVAVAQAVFSHLTRPALETIRNEWERARKSDLGGQHARCIALDQAQRRVTDLRARLLLISPELRELAEDFEVQLDEALGNLKRLKAAAISEPSNETLFTKDAFDELIALCDDLPGLFYAVSTTHRDRKEIVRTLIERVLVMGRTPETISAVISWADGSEATPVAAHLHRFAHRLIRELADQGLSNVEIAKRLNEMGHTTSRGKPWTRETVWVVRFPKGSSRASKRIRKAS